MSPPGTKIPWWALAGGGVLLALILAAAGFALGHAAAPGQTDAQAQQARARTLAFQASRQQAASAAYQPAYEQALPGGRTAGRRHGARDGARRGKADAQDAAQRERDRVASQVSDCPDFTDLPLFDISVRGIDCATGTALVREAATEKCTTSTSCTLSNGFACSEVSSTPLSVQIRCSDGLRAVRYTAGD